MIMMMMMITFAVKLLKDRKTDRQTDQIA